MAIKKRTLAAVVAVAIGLGSVGQASAYIYAGSRLLSQNLSIGIFDSAGNPIAAQAFNFNLTNTAGLNGAADVDIASCSGTFGLPSSSGNCGGGGSGANTVLGGSTDISTSVSAGPNVTEVPVGARGGEDNYTYLGPGIGEYGTSDSVIDNAQLVNDPTTSTRQIAETELQSGTEASGSARISSTTGFSFNFTLPTTGSIVMTFQADPDLLAEINDAAAIGATAQATMETEFNFNQDLDGAGNSGTDFVLWRPQGTFGFIGSNDCVLLGAGTCLETADGEDLNNQSNVATTPLSSDPFSRNNGVFSDFGVTITGLAAGDWSFSLTASTSATVTRQVPEPELMLTLGLSFALLSFVSYRRKKNQAS